MAFQAGGKVVEAFPGDVEGILVHGGAAILTFFNDSIVGAQLAGKDTGPTNFDGVADGERSGDTGWVEAPSVGIAEAKDGLH